jgi:hypothetical protein
MSAFCARTCSACSCGRIPCCSRSSGRTGCCWTRSVPDIALTVGCARHDGAQLRQFEQNVSAARSAGRPGHGQPEPDRAADDDDWSSGRAGGVVAGQGAPAAGGTAEQYYATGMQMMAQELVCHGPDGVRAAGAEFPEHRACAGRAVPARRGVLPRGSSTTRRTARWSRSPSGGRRGAVAGRAVPGGRHCRRASRLCPSAEPTTSGSARATRESEEARQAAAEAAEPAARLDALPVLPRDGGSRRRFPHQPGGRAVRRRRECLGAASASPRTSTWRSGSSSSRSGTAPPSRTTGTSSEVDPAALREAAHHGLRDRADGQRHGGRARRLNVDEVASDKIGELVMEQLGRGTTLHTCATRRCTGTFRISMSSTRN